MNKIQKLREQKGLTIEELSDAVGLEERLLVMAETGGLGNGIIQVCGILAEYFGVSIVQLLGNVEVNGTDKELKEIGLSDYQISIYKTLDEIMFIERGSLMFLKK